MFLDDYRLLEKCLNDSLVYLVSDFSDIYRKVYNSKNIDEEVSYREEFNNVLLKLFDNLSSFVDLNAELLYDLSKAISERDSFKPISDELFDHTEVDDG